MERGRGGSGGRGGGRTFQRNNAGEEWPNLVGVVLSWSLADVMNENLFKDKVGAPHRSSHTLIYLLDRFLAGSARHQGLRDLRVALIRSSLQFNFTLGVHLEC